VKAAAVLVPAETLVQRWRPVEHPAASGGGGVEAKRVSDAHRGREQAVGSAQQARGDAEQRVDPQDIAIDATVFCESQEQMT
jgi:hypothetical protein